jgi:hypothetical protein
MQMKIQQSEQTVSLKARGYVILFTVLVASIVLAIALGISSVAYREVTFNIEARDSHYALFAADSAAECALHHLRLATDNPFTDAQTGDWLPSVTITCGESNGQPVHLSAENAGDSITPDYVFNINADPPFGPLGVMLPKGCGVPRVVETTFNGQNYLRVQGIGYNVDCASFFANGFTQRTVQRAIEYTYFLDTTQGVDNANTGTPNDGHGVLNVSAFDPSSINGTIMTHNTVDSGVLGNSLGGTLWGNITDFFNNLLGIQSTVNQGNPPTQNFKTQPNSPDSYAPAIMPDGSPAYYQDNSTGNTYQNAPDMNAAKTSSLPDTQARLATGTRINTLYDMPRTDSEALLWLDRFAGNDPANLELIDTANTLRKQDVPSNTEYASMITDIKALPDGDEKNTAIVKTLLSRYAAMTGDTEFASSVDATRLFEVAKEISFDGENQTPESVQKLFDTYGKVTGNTTPSKTVDATIFSRLISEFTNLSKQPTVEQPQMAVSGVRQVLVSIQNLFQRLLRIRDVDVAQETAMMGDSPDYQIQTARRIISKYADASGNWTTVENISPEVLAKIFSYYGSDGVVTDDAASLILKEYQQAVGIKPTYQSIDPTLFAQVANEVRLENRLVPQAQLEYPENEVTPEAARKVWEQAGPMFGITDLSGVTGDSLAKYMNGVLPKGTITPDLTKAFLEKYGSAIGNEKLSSEVDVEAFTKLLNTIREESNQELRMRVEQKPISIITRLQNLFGQLFLRNKVITTADQMLSTTRPIEKIAVSVSSEDSYAEIYKMAINLGIDEDSAALVATDAVKNSILTEVSKERIDSKYGSELWNKIYGEVKLYFYNLKNNQASTVPLSQPATDLSNGIYSIALKFTGDPESAKVVASDFADNGSLTDISQKFISEKYGKDAWDALVTGVETYLSPRAVEAVPAAQTSPASTDSFFQSVLQLFR